MTDPLDQSRDYDVDGYIDDAMDRERNEERNRLTNAAWCDGFWVGVAFGCIGMALLAAIASAFLK